MKVNQRASTHTCKQSGGTVASGELSHTETQVESMPMESYLQEDVIPLTNEQVDVKPGAHFTENTSHDEAGSSTESRIPEVATKVDFSGQTGPDSEKPTPSTSSSPKAGRKAKKPKDQTMLLKGIPSTGRSERRCLICKSLTGRKRIPKLAIRQAWLEKQILIRNGNRCCEEHLKYKKFTPGALGHLKATKDYVELSSLEVYDLIEWVHQEAEKRNKEQKILAKFFKKMRSK